jgi:hypothetical protein
MRRLLVLAGAVLLTIVASLLLAPGSFASEGARGQVIVIGVPGLSLEHVDQWTAIAQRGSVGAVSVRTFADVTCAPAGWLSLGAGNRAAGESGDASTCKKQDLVVEQAGDGASVHGFADLSRHNASLTTGTRLGALGSALRNHGLCVAAAGPGAALAAADDGGHVPVYEANSSSASHAAFLTRCPVTIIEGSQVDIKELVASVDAARAPNSTLLIVGVSEASSPIKAHLHLALADGPQFTGGWLTSASTGRTPYVQLVDIAPTVLSALGIAAPSSMIGQPIHAASSSLTGAARLQRLADLDLQAVRHHAAAPIAFAVIAIGQAAFYLSIYAMLRWARARHKISRQRVLLRVGRVVAVGGIASMGATFLANFVPWWRAGFPLIAVLGVVAAFTVVLVVAAYAGPWRRKALGPPAAAAALVALIIGLDLLSGAHLQLASLAGYSPLVAGRFAGLGNVAFGVFGAAALLAAAGAAAAVRQRGHTPLAAGLTVACVGLIAAAIDGGPWWGSDFGGVVALLPAFAYLALVVARIRLTWIRVIGTCVGTGVVVLAGCFLDYARPAASQTHLGRFAGQILHGGAATVIHRKAEANWALLTHSPLTLAVPAGMAVAAYLLLAPPGALRGILNRAPFLRHGLVAVLVMSIVGMLANDSGIAIPAMALMIAVPSVLALVAASIPIRESFGRVGTEPATRVLP